jgi:plastocyanin
MRALAALPLLLAGLAAAPAVAGEVAGRVTLALEGTRLADLGPVIVFLEGKGDSPVAPRGGPRATIRQHNARFDPEFLVVNAGQGVAMPNDDTIFHNVFSFSRPNDFDLGVYPAGESRTVTFDHPGLVKIYCSIHESMSAAVLVAPSPWFATASPAGEYRIADVPPGHYRLTVWNEKLPPASRSVQVGRDSTLRADVALGAVAP